MTSPPRTLPVVTPLQSAYLAVLTDGPLTGKEMRAELSYCGWHRRKAAFFRVIQTLKQANLIDATRIPREEEEYRGAQCVDELTQ